MKNSKQNSNWKTPSYFYDPLNEEFNFDFDPCPYNHDLKKWNGLKVSWGQRNFVNPPYDLKNKTAFIFKGLEEFKKGKLSVFLLPVSTSTNLFHNYINKYKTEDIRFVHKRIKFEGFNSKNIYVKNLIGQYESMIVIFDGRI